MSSIKIAGVDYTTDLTSRFEPRWANDYENGVVTTQFYDAGTQVVIPQGGSYFGRYNNSGVVKTAGIATKWKAPDCGLLVNGVDLTNYYIRKGMVFAGGTNTTAYGPFNATPNISVTTVGTSYPTLTKSHVYVVIIGGGANGTTSTGGSLNGGTYHGGSGGSGGGSGSIIDQLIEVNPSNLSLTVVVGGIGTASSLTYVAADGTGTKTLTAAGGLEGRFPGGAGGISHAGETNATGKNGSYYYAAGAPLSKTGYNRNLTTELFLSSGYGGNGGKILTSSSSPYYYPSGGGGGGGGSCYISNGVSGGVGGNAAYGLAAASGGCGASAGSYGGGGSGGGGGGANPASGGFSYSQPGGSGYQGAVFIFY